MFRYELITLFCCSVSGTFSDCFSLGDKQIPLYPTTIFQGETDGEGMNIVLYFKLSDNYSKKLPLHFQESIQVNLKL